MAETFQPTTRAEGIRTAMHGLALDAHDLRAAGRAMIGHVELALAAVAPRKYRAHDLRDDVARSLHDHVVADAHVLEPDHVLVVERRHAHDHTADGDGLEHRVRVQGARAADVDADVDQARDGGRGRELDRDRPAGIAADGAERLLLIAPIDLDHAAVDVVLELGAP